MEYRTVVIITLFVVVFCNRVYSCSLQSPRDHQPNVGKNRSLTADIGSFYKDYHRLDEVIEYIKSLAKKNSSIAKVISIGKSFEERDMTVIKISSNTSKNKPAIWIDGGIHAREWISIPVVVFITEQLLTSDGKDLINTYDWHILPVVNPDGYEYSHTTDRDWRKNRNNRNKDCAGVDLNRNFDVHWSESGSSDDPCTENYAGSSAASEPETKAISGYILKEKKKGGISAYLTFHSFAQAWLLPWGWTDERPDDYEEMAALAKKATDALFKVNGTEYEIKQSSQLDVITGVVSGISADWAKSSAGVKYAYSVELPDKGGDFRMPKERIPTVVKETWEAVKAFAKALKTKETL